MFDSDVSIEVPIVVFRFLTCFYRPLALAFQHWPAPKELSKLESALSIRRQTNTRLFFLNDARVIIVEVGASWAARQQNQTLLVTMLYSVMPRNVSTSSSEEERG